MDNKKTMLLRPAKTRISLLCIPALAAALFAVPNPPAAKTPTPFSPIARTSTPAAPLPAHAPVWKHAKAPSKSAAKASEPQYPDPTKLTFDPLNWTVPLGLPYRDSLSNGLRCYVAVDSQLPLVQVTAYFKWGTLLDSAGREGASALMARLMRTGGTERYDPDSIDALIDRYALNFRVSASEDRMQFTASFLSDYMELAFNLMQQMLFNPRFDQSKLDIEKKNSIEGMRHQYENPGPTVGAAYQKLMYARSPAARSVTEQSLKQIRRKDLLSLHRKAIGTSNCIIAVAGKFSRIAMIDRLERMFPAAGAPRPIVFPESPVKPNRKCLIVQKPISQVYVQFGVPLFKRPNDDYYAASLASFILGGGGFTSRLGTKVRSDAGLTYHIHSDAESNYTYPATWYIEFFTKSSSFGQAMDLSLAVTRDMRINGVTDAELANARETMIGGMPSNFRSPFDIVSMYAWNEYYGRSPFIFRDYPDALRAVTKADVQRVLYAYFDPDLCSYAVVGDTAALHKYGSYGEFALDKLNPQRTISADSLSKMK